MTWERGKSPERAMGTSLANPAALRNVARAGIQIRFGKAGVINNESISEISLRVS